MSVVVNLNGIPYLIPQVGEVGWGQEVTSYLVALSTGVLSLEGGNFPLQGELNLGPNFGVASPYFKSGQPNASTTGVVRLTNTEGVFWRNATNTADLGLTVSGNNLLFNGLPIGGGTSSPLISKGDIYTYSTTNARLPVGLNGQVLIADSSAATGLAWGAGGGGGGGSVTGFTFTNQPNGIVGNVTNPNVSPTLTLSLTDIKPTSVAATGIVSGSNISGTSTLSGSSSGLNTGDQTITLNGAITGSGTGAFTTTYNGVVPITKGGTGAITANAAFNLLAPPQAAQSGKVLITNGTDTSWASFPGAGSVTSVSAAGSQGVTIAGSPITTTGTITVGLGAITPTSVTATGNVLGANINGTVTGTNTGDQTISLTGDASGSGTGTINVVLAETAVKPGGSFTRANITVDSKGRITAASDGALQTITLSGDISGSGIGPITTVLPNIVTAGNYNNVQVNAKGQVTSGTLQGYISGNQPITLSGDVDNSTGTTTLSAVLKTLPGLTAATYNFANVTVNTKGQVTAITSGSPVTNVSGTNGTDINVTVANGSSTPVVSAALKPTGVTAATYNFATVAVDANGRITSASSGNPVTVVNGGTTADILVSVAGSNTPLVSASLVAVPGLVANTYNLANVSVDNKGRITAIAAGNPSFTFTGDVTGSGTSPVALTIPNTGVTAGTYGANTKSAQITINAKGQITSATEVTITALTEEIFTALTFNGTPYTVPNNSNNTIVVTGLSANTAVTLPAASNPLAVRTMTWFLPKSGSNVSFIAPVGTTLVWENGLTPTLSTTTSTIIVLSFVPPTNLWMGVASLGYPT